jgi:hypothetical protein
VSDARVQVERVIGESDIPADGTVEETAEVENPGDRTRKFTHTGLSRMKLEWPGADRDAIVVIKDEANKCVKQQFSGAFAVIEQIYKCVRRPLADDDGVLRVHDDGTPMWEKDEWGQPAEDWGLLDDNTRMRLRHSIVIRLFEWELLAVDQWAEAMYAKVNWEEAFAQGFLAMPGHQAGGKPTIDDRTQFGHRHSNDARYFAVFKSAVSRRADAIVRSMIRLDRVLESTTIR